MSTLVAALFNLLHVERFEREDGLEAVEYALIAALIAVAVMGIVGTLGGQLNDVFTQVSNALTNAGAAN